MQLASAGFGCDSFSFIQTEASVSRETEIFIQELANKSALILFTSAQAVRSVATYCKTIAPDWSVYCISGATKNEVVSFLGEEKVLATGNDAIDLVKEIAKGEKKDIVFFCGNKRLDTLPKLLSNQGFRIQECEVYQTRLTPVILEKNYDGILFFSPSGIESYLFQNTIPNHATLFTIGNTTAKHLAAICTNQIIVSPTPDKNILINTLIEFYKNRAI
jgi:uroporphyrinogen-III synthase